MTQPIAMQDSSSPGGGLKGGQTAILVVCATRHGSTRGVAEAIGARLTQAGHLVDVRSVDEVTDLERYEMVVIGSPIQYDRWLPEASNFVLAHQTRLSEIPVAYFFTCLTLSRRNAKTERQAQGYADK